ncbi:MAG TPA: hypothetical protein EYP98_12020, partial [Planctomycetes bacterium]|nr:hypothetical protein [Planctomycetota bacterium]
MSQADSIPTRAGQYPNDHCPLCGGDNQCANSAAGDAAAGPPCWCKSVQIPEAVLDCLPEQARGVACICATCAKQAAPTTVPGVHQIVDQGQRPALQLAANGQRVLISLTGAQVLFLIRDPVKPLDGGGGGRSRDRILLIIIVIDLIMFFILIIIILILLL